MAHTHIIVQPGLRPGSLLAETGGVLTPPVGWAFLKAGDAAITRSVKTKGVTWVVQVRKGRRYIVTGIWANGEDILAARREVTAKRATPAYQQRRQREIARRQAKQEAYVVEFCLAVVSFLDFHRRYYNEAQILAAKITAHATPVGSGTVARTQRIPIDQRAEAAVIAWMRHQTTAYESMPIARVKGKRREIRRQLAARSIAVLQVYRQGLAVAENCPLQKALS